MNDIALMIQQVINEYGSKVTLKKGSTTAEYMAFVCPTVSNRQYNLEGKLESTGVDNTNMMNYYANDPLGDNIAVGDIVVAMGERLRVRKVQRYFFKNKVLYTIAMLSEAKQGNYI